MNGLTCPKCQGSMRSYERSGVTVDQCSECRGIFLDRGELERLVDVENAHYGQQQQQPPPQREEYRQPDYREQPYREQPYREREHHGGGYGHGHGHKKKKRSIFEELFD